MSSSTPTPASTSILLRGVTPIDWLEDEIRRTIPAKGTGDDFNDRQALLLLRLRHSERHERATNLWGPKGRHRAVRGDWYLDVVTDADLWYVGLEKDNSDSAAGGERRDANSNKVRNLKVKDAEWVTHWKNGRVAGYFEPVEGVDLALGYLGLELDPPVDDEDRMKVSVVWLHDMDGPLAQEALHHSIHGEKCLTEDGGDREDGHVADILLDTSNITTGKFLSQLDAAITQYPHADWKYLKLHWVEFNDRIGSDVFKLSLQARYGEALTQMKMEDSSADLGFLPVFVGYEYVSEEEARSARDTWSRDL